MYPQVERNEWNTNFLQHRLQTAYFTISLKKHFTLVENYFFWNIIIQVSAKG